MEQLITKEVDTKHSVTPLTKRYPFFNPSLSGVGMRRKNPFTREMFDFRNHIIGDQQYVCRNEWIDLGKCEDGKTNQIRFERKFIADLISHPLLFINRGFNHGYVTPSNLIKRIEMTIGGNTVFSCVGIELEILLKLYGLTAKHTNDGYIIPLPIDLMYGNNALLWSELKYHEVMIDIEFCEGFIFNNAALRFTGITFDRLTTECFLDKKQEFGGVINFFQNLICPVSDPLIRPTVKHQFATRTLSRQQYPFSETKYVLPFVPLFSEAVSCIYFYFSTNTGYLDESTKLFDNVTLQFNGKDFVKYSAVECISVVEQHPHIYCLHLTDTEHIQDFNKGTIDFSTIDNVQLSFEGIPTFYKTIGGAPLVKDNVTLHVLMINQQVAEISGETFQFLDHKHLSN
jgi:hypothetical protein